MKFWGFAVDQLPYDSAESGYQAATWDTEEVLFDEEALSLPRDKQGRLHRAILNHLTDETWCEYDWLTLDEDVALRTSWERFCDTIKHERRFFFYAVGQNPDERDAYSAEALLRTIAHLKVSSLTSLELSKRGLDCGELALT
jgi:HEPN/RES N-terminal domain 1